jgi:hypothetical protein
VIVQSIAEKGIANISFTVPRNELAVTEHGSGPQGRPHQ